MALLDDLKSDVQNIFATKWEIRNGTVIPDDSNIKLGNDAVNINATVLYADLSDSTKLVDSQKPTFAAEIYKSYLVCAAKLIRNRGGVITAYDGDRVMGIFKGDDKNSVAARVALEINYAVKEIINPAIIKEYGNGKYTVKHTVGIDTSDLFVAKTGVRGANDLVWVGRAANYAAKLSSLNTYRTYITYSVYDSLSTQTKFSGGVDMWTKLNWTAMGDLRIYGSDYHWGI